MFGKNPIVGQSFFEDTNKLFVTSMFMTLQGEGPFRGEPAFFVRLAKCNLACSFCDTYFDSGSWMTPEKVIEQAKNAISDFFKNEIPQWGAYIKNYYAPLHQHDNPPNYNKKRQMIFVVTGGEPMLQKSIGKLLELASEEYQHTQIETNGSIWQNIPETTILVCSPKCLEKHGKVVRYLKPHPKILERANCLKFVMNDDPNSPYSSIPDWALKHREKTGIPIFVSPMNIYLREPLKAKHARLNANLSLQERNAEEVISFWEEGLLDMEANRKNHEYAAKYCIQHGLIFNLQMHLYASLA